MLFVILAVAVGLLPCAGGAARTQLVSRGDFECDWTDFRSVFTIEGAGSNVILDASVKWRGDKSLKVANRSIAPTFADQLVPIDCSGGPRRVRVSLMCRARGVVRGCYPWYGVRCIVWICDSSGAPVTDALNVYDLTAYPTGSFEWRRYERTLILPKSVRNIKLQLGLDNASGEAWFDDVEIAEVKDDYLIAEDDSAQVTINPRAVTSRMNEGIGWCWETVSPERFSAAELEVWPELFRNMAWDGSDWISIRVQPAMCPPAEYVRGKDTGQRYTYSFNTTQIKKICELLSFCQSRGITVLLTNHVAGSQDYEGVPNGMWLMKGYYDGTGASAPDWWMPYSKDRFAEYLTELTYYLRVTKGFTCIKYVSAWNEPNGPWTEIGQYPQGFMDLLKRLHRKMVVRGIRGLVKIAGLDAVEAGDNVRTTINAVRDEGSMIDAVLVHDYSYGLDRPTETMYTGYIDEWAKDYAPLIRQLNTMRRRPVPLMIAETNGFGTYATYGSREHYLCSLSSAEYVIEMLKIGCDGILRWQYNDPGNTQFEPFTLSSRHAVPNKELYYPWSVITRWIVKSSDVLSTKVTGGLDAENRKLVRAVALRGPGGEVTVLVTNIGRLPKKIRIGLRKADRHAWHHYYYDGALPNSILEGSASVVDGNTLTATLTPESVNVFTTFKTGLTGDAPR